MRGPRLLAWAPRSPGVSVSALPATAVTVGPKPASRDGAGDSPVWSPILTEGGGESPAPAPRRSQSPFFVFSVERYFVMVCFFITF